MSEAGNINICVGYTNIGYIGIFKSSPFTHAQLQLRLNDDDQTNITQARTLYV